MNSLSQLNTFSATVLDVTDLRGSKVIFNRKSPLDAVDQVLTITTTTTQIDPGIEIEEIINYQTANVRYVVTIVPGVANPLVGSTITWTSLPAGVVLTQGGGVYTISNISTLEQWAAIKSFNWNLPANATSYPLWYLSVQVIYYDSKLGTDVDKSWLAYDDRYYYLSGMQSSTSLACPGEKLVLATAGLNSNSSLYGVNGKLQIASSTISSSFTVTASGGIVFSNMTMTSTMSASLLVLKRLDATINLTSSVSVPTTKLTKNISRARTYVGNNENILFPTNVPYIDSTDTSGSYTITLSSSIGTFSSSSTVDPVTPWSYTGTLAQVNAIYSQILFYPTKNVSSSGTITYTHALGGTTEFTRTINLTGTAGSLPTQTLTFTTVGTTVWKPTNIQAKYGVMDILLVAGGGGGGTAGGGGGGVREVFNEPLALQNYSIAVGVGGTGHNISTGNALTNGTNGGTTNIFGSGTTTNYSATGGQKSYQSGVLYPAGHGGSSGTPTTNGSSGSAFAGAATNNFTTDAGAYRHYFIPGGGGAGAVAPTLSPDNYIELGGPGGAGYLSTITGNYYGGGGAGIYGAYFPTSKYKGDGRQGIGGIGGGGRGGETTGLFPNASYTVFNGTANTGGGGGGIWPPQSGNSPNIYKGGDGGSGVVVIKIHS